MQCAVLCSLVCENNHRAEYFRLFDYLCHLSLWNVRICMVVYSNVWKANTWYTIRHFHERYNTPTATNTDVFMTNKVSHENTNNKTYLHLRSGIRAGATRMTTQSELIADLDAQESPRCLTMEWLNLAECENGLSARIIVWGQPIMSEWPSCNVW